MAMISYALFFLDLKAVTLKFRRNVMINFEINTITQKTVERDWNCSGERIRTSQLKWISVCFQINA
jgi:hypothetical protein